MRAATNGLSVLVRIRLPKRDREFVAPWPEVDVHTLRSAAPWRTFRSYKGQRHYSGTYWSSTTRSHVSYESRLELTGLPYADFDGSVYGIIAQPFLFRKEISGRMRKHVLDFLLLTDSGPVVVDVKPQCRVRKPEIAFVLSWTREKKHIGRGVWRRPWSGVSWFGDDGQVGLVDPVDAGSYSLIRPPRTGR